LKNGKWSVPFFIPRIGPFVPVGADFGPDGKFYLLERHIGGIFGFRTRVRRFIVQGNHIGAGEQLLKTTAGTHDNLEGLAVWQDEGGDIRLTMVSDNNFNFLQRTEFVEYHVQE